jgi:hypothetical protein
MAQFYPVQMRERLLRLQSNCRRAAAQTQLQLAVETHFTMANRMRFA